MNSPTDSPNPPVTAAGRPAGSTFLEHEVASQPDCWRRAAALLPDVAEALPAPGEEAAFVGCGTSLFMSQSAAVLREQRGHGRTDAFAASEHRDLTGYDRVVVLTRSGTTTEVISVLESLAGVVPTTVVTAVADSPVTRLADRVILLDFADESSVVQTRFATTFLALVRAWTGEDLTAAIEDAERVLAAAEDPVVAELVPAEQVTFLGRGWTVGLVSEAALKLRESCQSWVESYPAMEYRHGPISIAEPGRAVWMIGDVPDGLEDDVRATGARFVASELDPMAELVRLHRLCLARAAARGLDPDHPRHLTRSIILDS